MRLWLRQLRVYQWSKNLIVFTPLVTSHQIADWSRLGEALGCAAAFCFAASMVYLINDLCDLAADRRHARKKHRPLASGALSVKQAVVAMPVLVALALACVVFFAPGALLLLSAYFAASVFYSCFLKRKLLLDVICLATLYVLRIIGGHEASGIPYSMWLLAFAMFFFFSLAMVKRYSELRSGREQGLSKLGGRGYQTVDLEVVMMLGAASGLLSVLVLALYINSTAGQKLYADPVHLLPLCPLMMYWIGRVWIIAHRGQMNEDPVLFALRDRMSYVVAACMCAVLLFASWR